MLTIERSELAPGFSISRILTGLWQIADMERDGTEVDIEAAAGAMKKFISAGFTTFDMADHYGSAENISGFVRKEQKKALQLFTKWVPKPGKVTRDEVRAAVQKSLVRMQSDALDMLQFHAWNYADPVWLDCLLWLQELKEEGLIRYLGMTNTDTAHLRMAIHSGIDIVSNQVCFSLLDQRAAGKMSEFCLKHGIKLLAFGTLAGGFLTEQWLDKPEPHMDTLQTWSQMKYKRFIDAAGGWDIFQQLLQAMAVTAKKHSVSLANVAAKTILDSPAVAGIIVGARLGEREHRIDNGRVFQFSLDKTDRQNIDAVLKQLKAIPGDCGDEYRRPPFLTASGDLSHHLETMPVPFEVHKSADGSLSLDSGTEWETLGGFSRAIRRGNRIFISGTTATHKKRLIGGSDAASQMHFIIDKISGILQSLGADLKDVVRTRIYVSNIADWETCARVHGEYFSVIKPANTFVQAGLVGQGYLVEMEAEALL